MAEYTQNYHLMKPGKDDLIDIKVLNENFETIDKEIKAAADAIPPIATQEKAGIVKPDGTTITVEPDGTIRGAQTYVLPQATKDTLGGVKIGENLTMGADGKLNAFANVETDAEPTSGSTKVPLSGGTYDMIDALNTQTNTLNSHVTALTTGLTWKEAVATYADIATTYDTPSAGWAVTCTDTGKSYYYDGTGWVFIFTSLVAVASVTDVKAILAAATGDSDVPAATERLIELGSNQTAVSEALADNASAINTRAVTLEQTYEEHYAFLLALADELNA